MKTLLDLVTGLGVVAVVYSVMTLSGILGKALYRKLKSSRWGRRLPDPGMICVWVILLGVLIFSSLLVGDSVRAWFALRAHVIEL